MPARGLLVVGLSLLLLTASVPSLAQGGQLDAYVEQARSTENVPGLSAAVWHQGEMVYSGGAGYAELENLTPATGHTVHNVGSVSKVLAVVGLMRLVEEGRVDIDQEIQTWVPDFPRKEWPITLRQVLTHTSGIRHYNADDFVEGGPFAENLRRFDSIDEALAIFQDDPLRFPPGEMWSYSSYATNLLQAVVESVSEQGFEEYLRRHVWEPAGMLATAFDVPTRIVRHRARGHRITKEGELTHEPYGDISYKYAGGGMISTAEDLVRFGAAINAGRILAPETIAKMYEPLEPLPLGFRLGREPQKLEFEQGLLWRWSTDAMGRKWVGHGGSVRGFRTAFVNYPDHDLVVAVICNAPSNPNRHAVAIAQRFLPPVHAAASR